MQLNKSGLDVLLFTINLKNAISVCYISRDRGRVLMANSFSDNKNRPYCHDINLHENVLDRFTTNGLLCNK